MKSLIWTSGLSGIVFLFASCTNQQPDPNDPGWGPFDSAGNYREDWADDPSKWQRPGSRKPAASAPVIARTDQPPAQATPLPAPRPAATAPTSPAAIAQTRPTPRPTATAQTRPTPRPAAKPKPKPAPKPPQPTRYTVKQGDTLWAIANRNGTSVTALQRANGISGSLIKPGQRLVIPKR